MCVLCCVSVCMCCGVCVCVCCVLYIYIYVCVCVWCARAYKSVHVLAGLLKCVLPIRWLITLVVTTVTEVTYVLFRECCSHSEAGVPMVPHPLCDRNPSLHSLCYCHWGWVCFSHYEGGTVHSFVLG